MKVALAAVSCLLAPTLWAAPPTDLTTDSICRDRLTARWTNAAGVVSNALEVIKVFPNAFEADYATNYTFDAISNSGKTVVALTRDDFDVLEPGFGGETIRVGTNITGKIQIGVSSGTNKTGCLEFAGRPSYENLTLVVYAQKMASNNPCSEMLIEFVTGEQTNELAKIAITNTMEHYEIPLNVVAGGSRLLFHSSSYKSDPRVLIDSIGFVRSYTLPYTQTNAVHAAAFPARDAYRVRGLEPLTRYCWRVRGDAADDWSEYATCETTNAAPPPLTVRVR